MSTFSNSETASASPSANHTSPSRETEDTDSQPSWPDDSSSEDGTPTLRMNHCPECGARRFVSKLLVYEVTGYDEGGEQEFRRQHVRAEFEYTCSECQTTLRTLPADRRDYYDEVAVLETERRAAFRDQLRQLGRRFWGRLAARTTWLASAIRRYRTGCQ
jgi:DNA-directed RNA polymerase subunit RPC12/RpoP